MRRLEKQGLLKSEWETKGSKPRKYYGLSDMGKEVYDILIKEWADMESTIDKLIERSR